YPDGTIFADDVRDFSVVDGAYLQGARKAIPVMVKDSKKYASTGGWGFQAWAGGDPAKPLVTDAVKVFSVSLDAEGARLHVLNVSPVAQARATAISLGRSRS